jgi:hypothetical protein
MRKVFFILAIAFSTFLLLPLTLYAGSNIEIVQVNYSLETNEVTIKGVNLTFFGIPSVSIGDSVLVDVCDYNSDSEIICDISQTLAVGGGSFPLRLSAGNAPHLNAKIDVYIPSSSNAANCIPGDIIMCYSGDPATINIGFCGAGYRVCDNDGTWGECMNEVTPEAEICDYTDNDCDGEVDEDFPLVNTSCQEGLGACQNVGVYICDPDDSNNVVCSVEAGTPSLEVCNSIDDDCDGEVDEDFPLKNTSCQVGVGVCQSFGVFVCDPNNPLSLVCNAVPGAGYIEVCNGIDDDCDGQVDEDFNLLNDPNNCGACGQECDPSQNCLSGSCANLCSPSNGEFGSTSHPDCPNSTDTCTYIGDPDWGICL